MNEKGRDEKNKKPEELSGKIGRNFLDKIRQELAVQRFEETKQELTNIFNLTYYLEAFARLDAEIYYEIKRQFNNSKDATTSQLSDREKIVWLYKHSIIDETTSSQLHAFRDIRNGIIHRFEEEYPEFRLYAELNKPNPDLDMNLFLSLVNERWEELTQQQKNKVNEISKKLEIEQDLAAEDEEFMEQTTRQLIEQKMERKITELRNSFNKGLDCLQKIIRR